MSKWCEQLETEFAAWLGVRGAVAAGFGRAALWLALEAAEVGGGEVLVPELICAQVTEAVRRAGARPAFYRVRRDLTVDAGEFEAALTPRTRAAIVVHYWGRVLPETSALAEICRRRGVFCLEDCALALGAVAGGCRAGSFGAAAVFSFTKSDWCYGGGLVASDSEAYLARVRALATDFSRSDARLACCYGLLRRLDFAANRPRWCGLATQAGLRLQRICFPGARDFYDAGRMDAALPEFAAPRALKLLRGLADSTVRRHAIVTRLYESLGARGGAFLWPESSAENTAAFVPLLVPEGSSALDWVNAADESGVTLRLTWPAYQKHEAGQRTEARKWWAERVVLLEVHPQLSASEVERIAKTLRRLAMRE